MSGMNVTEAQLAELERNLKNISAMQLETIDRAVNVTWVGPRPPSGRLRKPPVQTFDGPVDVVLTLHGHCPSKKNDWERGETGMFLPKEVADQIKILITQAMYGWGLRGPVEHPELTVTFFVAAQRQDQDGMYVTILDVLQKAGVLVNDNIKRNNGRKVLEPCEFVSSSEERVEIRVVKK